MPARKSQLQGLKTCNRLGVEKKKRGAPGARSERRPRRDRVRIGGVVKRTQNRSPQSYRNNDLGGLETGRGEGKKNEFGLIFFCLCLKSKTHPHFSQLPAAPLPQNR